MPNLILNALQNVQPENELEQKIKDNLLEYNPNPQLDDLLSHIEERFNLSNVPGIDLDGEPLTPENPFYELHYQDGINFLTKYNLMP